MLFDDLGPILKYVKAKRYTKLNVRAKTQCDEYDNWLQTRRVLKGGPMNRFPSCIRALVALASHKVLSALTPLP
jgi:hypothetical protein